MAKATKPGSGDKTTPQTSKAAADTDETSAEKPVETSSASKAAQTASSGKMTAPAKAEGANTEAKTAAPVAAAAPEAAKPTEPAPKASSDAKPADEKAASVPVADETKGGPAKPASADKAVEDHKPTAAKPDLPKSTDAAKPAAAVSKPPSTPAAPQKGKSVFWPLVLGGVVAGAAGFMLSELDVLNTRADTARIEQALAAQDERLAKLESAEAPTPSEAAMPDLGGIETALTALSDAVGGIEARLDELEARPAASGDAAPGADYSDELAALQSSIEEQRAEIERLIANAQSVEDATASAAREAALRAALTEITAALTSGSGYTTALDDLTENGVNEVPQALAAPADSGVPTLASLQAEFPDTARAALAAARAAGADGEDGGVGSFLRRQLGARSVQPREGSDPDAVLSRAEAAVRDGRIANALAEIATLPPEAQAAMEGWLEGARARAEAEAAVQDLSQRLTAN